MSNMVLNNKIKKAMFESLDKFRIKRNCELCYGELQSEELTLLEFVGLSSLYNLKYNFIIQIPTCKCYYTSDNDYMVYDIIDYLYKNYTGKSIQSSKLKYSEVKDLFNRINGDIVIE